MICNGIWSIDPIEIKHSVASFFASRFKEEYRSRPDFFSSSFSKLPTEDAAKLDAPFSIPEIEAAVWSCDGSKAPGPDGLTFTFIQKYWSTLKDAFVEVVLHFGRTGSLARGYNASFIALVAKK